MGFAIVFTTILMFSLIATSQTIVTVRVSDAHDDIEEIRIAIMDTAVAGNYDLVSSDLELCTENNTQYVGKVISELKNNKASADPVWIELANQPGGI